MCTIPPPPPPPDQPTLNSSPKVAKINVIREPMFENDICQWAAELTELREACVRNRICLDKAPFRYKYKYFESISQVGPTCGLVALSMSVEGEVSPDELLSIAKLEGFTNNGEMFSCKQMVKLAEKAHSLAEIEYVQCTLVRGTLFSKETVARLLDGAILLVPYDADVNHSPCQRNGHTAHWAIVCGVIIVDNVEDSCEDYPDNVYVLCKHGKSQYLAVWKLSDLANSNSNLREFSPKKKADGLIYILPEGGIGGDNGLRDQFLVFETS